MEPNQTKEQKRENARRGMAIADSFPEDIPVYLYAGHGRDDCDPVTKKILIARVPENSIYVTIIECGELLDAERIVKFFSALKKQNFDMNILKKPYLIKNLLKLSNLLEISHTNIHVHLPGSLYVVSTFLPISITNNKEALFLSNSGLLDLKDFIERGQPYDEGFSFSKKQADRLPETIKKSVFINRYFPELSLAIRPYVREKFNEKFNEKETLTKQEVLDFFENSVSILTKKQVLDSFITSRYPTQEEVKEKIEALTDKTFLDKKDMEDITDQIKPIKNTELMERFPGIHFNLVCRYVSPSCLQTDIGMRRVSSAAENEERRSELRSESPGNSFLYEIDPVLKRGPSNIEEYINSRSILLQSLPLQSKKEIGMLVIEKLFKLSENNILSQKDTSLLSFKLFNSLFPFPDTLNIQDLIPILLEYKDFFDFGAMKRIPGESYLLRTQMEGLLEKIDESSITRLTHEEKQELLEKFKGNKELQYFLTYSPFDERKFKELLKWNETAATQPATTSSSTTMIQNGINSGKKRKMRKVSGGSTRKYKKVKKSRKSRKF